MTLGKTRFQDIGHGEGVERQHTEDLGVWLRDFRPEGRALALFQVFERFPHLLAFDGYCWRHQCETSISLSAFLLEGDPSNSLLHIRLRESISLCPPLFRVQAQAEGTGLEARVVEDWIAQGTIAWLRQLGSVSITGVLRYSLFTALEGLDRQRYPKVLETLAQLPIIPLGNGEWLELRQIYTFERVFSCAQANGLGWKEGVPVLQSTGQYSQLSKFLPAEMEIIPLDDF